MAKKSELIENRARVWEEAKSFLSEHEDENGNLNAEDSEKYARMEAELDSLTDSIKRYDKFEAIEAELDKPVSEPMVDAPEAEAKFGTASKEYKDAMVDAVRNNFSRVSNVLEEGTDATGGYLVPDEWDSELVHKLEDEVIMRQLGTVMKTQHGTHKIPIYASKDSAVWLGESDAFTALDETFGEVELDAFKLGGLIKISDELLEDNTYNLESEIVNELYKKLARGEESAFLTGNGTNKPTGVFDATAGGESAGTLTTAMTGDDLIDLVHALKVPYRKNAQFIMHDGIVKEIRKLKDNQGQYIWQPAYQAGDADMVLGYKVNTSNYAPERSIAFGNFSYYRIADRGNRSVQALRELFAGNGQVGFLGKERVDGKLVLREAVKVLGLVDTAANKKSSK